MTKRLGFLACLAVLLVAPAQAAEPWKGALACTFKKGNAATQVKGRFKQTRATPITFEVQAIDLEGQNAEIIAKPGAPPGKLRVVRALNANHFIEVLTEGFLSLTTIYDPDARTGTYPAVHSRHVGVFGQAIVAQYTGTCVPK